MSSVTDTEDKGEHEHGQERGPSLKDRLAATTAVKFSWGVSRQVAAVFSAIGFVTLIEHFWHIGLRGILAWLVGIWSQTVRPATAFVFHIVVTDPLSWLGVHFEVPLTARDYFSVGLILALSQRRVFRQGPTVSRLQATYVSRSTKLKQPKSGSQASSKKTATTRVSIPVPSPVILLVTWPLFLLADLGWLAFALAALCINAFVHVQIVFFRLAAKTRPTPTLRSWLSSYTTEGLGQLLRMRAPIIYVAMLLAINQWLLK